MPERSRDHCLEALTGLPFLSVYWARQHSSIYRSVSFRSGRGHKESLMSGSQTLFLGALGSPALPPATNKAVLLLMFFLFWEVGIVGGMGRGVTFYFLLHCRAS